MGAASRILSAPVRPDLADDFSAMKVAAAAAGAAIDVAGQGAPAGLLEAYKASWSPEQLAGYEALPEPERRRIDLLIAQQVEVSEGRARYALTFREFVDHVTAGHYEWYRFAEVLGSVLQRVADGELKRVLISAPPRHGKSEPVSRLFPAYCLYRHADWWIGLLSYGASLAQGFSRNARQFYAQEVGWLPGRVAKGVTYWETGRGGGLWAQGARGALLGKGYHVGVVDDPLKNAEEAASPKMRESTWEFYSTTFYTRQEPDAAIVVVMQRWDEDDLIGRILEQEWQAWEDLQAGEDDSCEHWHIVHLPALAESAAELADYEREHGRPMFPPSCTVEQDWRAPGEALCPERYDVATLRKMRKRIGKFYFNALYQQRPRIRGGTIFSPDCLITLDPQDFLRWITDPRTALVRWWDEAATPGGGDFTVGTLMARIPHATDPLAHRYIIVDVVRGQWGPDERDRIIRDTCYADFRAYGDRVTFGAEEEGGASGKTSALFLRRMLAGLPVRTERPTGSKLIRATAPGGLATAAGNGDLYMIRATWNAAVRLEFIEFTGEPSTESRHDDIVDTAAAAYNYLARKRMARRGSGASVSVQTLS